MDKTTCYALSSSKYYISRIILFIICVLPTTIINKEKNECVLFHNNISFTSKSRLAYLNGINTGTTLTVVWCNAGVQFSRKCRKSSIGIRILRNSSVVYGLDWNHSFNVTKAVGCDDNFYKKA